MQSNTPSSDPLARLAEGQHWIPPQAEQSVQNSIKSSFEAMGPLGDKIRSALRGEWLNEPLHAVLTDIPVGAWTAAAVFDTLGALRNSSALDAAADASVALGLVGAVGAAVTGANDWAEIKSEGPRRIGTVHALLNITATAFYAGSLFLRRGRGSRAQGRYLGFVGYLVVSVSAHLGGNLVYEHGVGVTSRQRTED